MDLYVPIPLSRLANHSLSKSRLGVRTNTIFFSFGTIDVEMPELLAVGKIYRGYYMAVWRYEIYMKNILRVSAANK